MRKICDEISFFLRFTDGNRLLGQGYFEKLSINFSARSCKYDSFVAFLYAIYLCKVVFVYQSSIEVMQAYRIYQRIECFWVDFFEYARDLRLELVCFDANHKVLVISLNDFADEISFFLRFTDGNRLLGQGYFEKLSINFSARSCKYDSFVAFLYAIYLCKVVFVYQSSIGGMILKLNVLCCVLC
ncbi:hypothetical protein QVD17_38250 [Tagetes erecta]|uniref:Uncharacterized protein n=1 Tax=Tagetes erecta TaxID=13708 RepID=A0AAD8NDD0_TARER|nr:hypothetical protein QVD17_38250 [Tagetes erecta]